MGRIHGRPWEPRFCGHHQFYGMRGRLSNCAAGDHLFLDVGGLKRAASFRRAQGKYPALHITAPNRWTNTSMHLTHTCACTHTHIHTRAPLGLQACVICRPTSPIEIGCKPATKVKTFYSTHIKKLKGTDKIHFNDTYC